MDHVCEARACAARDRDRCLPSQRGPCGLCGARARTLVDASVRRPLRGGAGRNQARQRFSPRIRRPAKAGFDRYEPSLVRHYLLDDVAAETGWPAGQPLALGRKDPNSASEPFNMAYLAMCTSYAVNGVSALHGAVSRRLFQPLFPHWPEHEVPIDHVTNGVHVPSWDSPWSDRIWTEWCSNAARSTIEQNRPRRGWRMCATIGPPSASGK